MAAIKASNRELVFMDHMLLVTSCVHCGIDQHQRDLNENHVSVSRIYRPIWNHALGVLAAVAENSKGCGKTGTGRKRVAFKLKKEIPA